MIEVGSINTNNSKDNTTEFCIRDKKAIIQHVLPIFDKYPLLTSKQFHYNQFRKAILIAENKNLSLEEKDKQITYIKNTTMPKDFISSAWNYANSNTISLPMVNTIISKEWLVGFTESKGNFYLVQKGTKRITHMFEITQKHDKIVLKAISIILSLSIYEKKTYSTCVSTNLQSIEQIISYYHNTIKGIKSLEYRI